MRLVPAPSFPLLRSEDLFFMHRLFLQTLLSELQLLLNVEREWALYFRTVEEGMFIWLTISKTFFVSSSALKDGGKKDRADN